MDKQYIAVDVEATGSTPANHSMISFGARVIGPHNKLYNPTFYRELKPVFSKFSMEAMKVGCLGLECLRGLKESDERYDPQSREFNPAMVLNVLYQSGTHSSTAMSDFGSWIKGVSESKKPILASDCVAFDGMWIHYYFDQTGLPNPFVYGGVDIGSMYRGMTGNVRNLKKSELWTSGDLTHNALEDAIAQAQALEKMLQLMKPKE